MPKYANKNFQIFVSRTMISTSSSCFEQCVIFKTFRKCETCQYIDIVSGKVTVGWVVVESEMDGNRHI